MIPGQTPSASLSAFYDCRSLQVTLGKSPSEAVDLAVRYVSDCIEATLPEFDEEWYGSCFELCLGKLAEYCKE